MKDGKLDSLWLLYRDTVFVAKQVISPKQQFAIVTACNPLGETVSDGANQVLDYRFQIYLQIHGIRAFSLFGCARDFSHIEKSWVLFCEQQQALASADFFQQNAIYWVCQNALYLQPVKTTAPAGEYLGSFSSRLLLDDHFSLINCKNASSDN